VKIFNHLLKSTLGDKLKRFKSAAEPIKTPNGTFHGFTDPEEIEILKKGGVFADVETHRVEKANEQAPDLLEKMKAGQNLDLTSYQKDAVLRLTAKGCQPATPSAAATKPLSSPAATKPESGKEPFGRGVCGNLPSVKQKAAESPPAATKPAALPVASPISQAASLPIPVAYKPGSSPFAKKPSFDHLAGVERTAASMKWQTDRTAWYAAEAERQIAAEESAAKVDPTAGKPVTAASIASEIIRQQADAAKPKASSWSREASSRRDRVAKLAAELAAKDPI